MQQEIQVGIIGGAGLAGGELLRILAMHPAATLHFVHSRSYADHEIAEAHSDLRPIYPGQLFTGICHHDLLKAVDVIFLCVGRDQARAFVNEYQLHDKGPVIIDLSQDHRIDDEYIYGLSEVVSSDMTKARQIANPGCFATAIQLPLYPFIESGDLSDEVHVTAITGSTGAGHSMSATSHFNWRHQNLSVYKAFNHQHLEEIEHHFERHGWSGQINFIPVRGCFTRGIMASMHFHSHLSHQNAMQRLKHYYEQSPFVHVMDETVDMKSVVNTNHCFIQVASHGNYLHLVSVIDNLIKGASGQAIQNMNMVFGLDEQQGLRLKPVAY